MWIVIDKRGRFDVSSWILIRLTESRMVGLTHILATKVAVHQ